MITTRPLQLFTTAAILAAVLMPLAVPGAIAATPPPAPSATASATTWSIVPAAEDKADGRVSIRQTVDPGGAIVDHLVVTNYGGAPASFLVYASDGIVTDAGDFDLLPPGQSPKDAGSWIEVGADGHYAPSRTVEIDAESSTVIDMRITVPDNATPGDHPAGVVAQLVGQNGGGVDVMARVGVRVHLRVAGELQPSLALGDVTTTYTPSLNPFAPGTLSVTAALSNPGNIRLGADAGITAAAPFGLLSAEGTAQVREILPGQETTVTAEFAMWPGFFVRGDVDVQPVVVGDDAVPEALATVATEFGLWAVPWSAIILLVVVAALVTSATLLLRGRSRRRKASFDAAVQERVRELAGDGGPRLDGEAASTTDAPSSTDLEHTR